MEKKLESLQKENTQQTDVIQELQREILVQSKELQRKTEEQIELQTKNEE